MFLTELKRVKRMVCELLYPTTVKQELPVTIPFDFHKSKPVLTVRFNVNSQQLEVSTHDLFSHDVKIDKEPVTFRITLSKNHRIINRDSLKVHMVASMNRASIVDPSTPVTELMRTVTVKSVRKDSRAYNFDLMAMSDIDEMAMEILKEARWTVFHLKERVFG